MCLSKKITDWLRLLTPFQISVTPQKYEPLDGQSFREGPCRCYRAPFTHKPHSLMVDKITPFTVFLVHTKTAFTSQPHARHTPCSYLRGNKCNIINYVTKMTIVKY